MATRTLNGYGVIGANDSSKGLFAWVTAWLGDHRRYRRTLDELSNLTDRELADIGIRRGEIDLVARQSVRG